MHPCKVKILVSCAFPFSIRNFVETGLVSEIMNEFGGDVEVVSPYNSEHLSLPGGTLVLNHWVESKHESWGLPTPLCMRPLDHIWRTLHMTGFSQEFPNASLMTMNHNNRRKPKWWAARFLRLLAPEHTKRRDWFRRLNHNRRPKRPRIVDIFDASKPDLLLVASPGHFPLDQVLMEESSRRGIPCVCIVLSWDNLYSRGPLLRRPDILAVWSTEMKRQAIEVHQFPADRIRIVGSLQFGLYASPVTPGDLGKIRRQIGLGSEEPYIAYVCGARTSRYDCEDVLQLINALRGTEFEHLRIVVRPHPQGDRKTYAELSVAKVLINESPDITKAGAKSDAMNHDAAKYMASFLTGAEFVVSSWGTTALLEACLFDRPSVQLRWYDSVAHSSPEEVILVRRFQKYLHMEFFDAVGARLFSDSPADLADCFRRLRSKESEFKEKRHRAVEQIAALPIAEANHRALDIFRELLSKKK